MASKNSSLELKEGEVLLKEYRAKEFFLFKRCPGTMYITNIRFIWRRDNFGGIETHWEFFILKKVYGS